MDDATVVATTKVLHERTVLNSLAGDDSSVDDEG